ncbi:DAF36 desaturase, partial [Acromyrmex charruanus]
YQFFQEPKEALSTFWTHCPHLGTNMVEGGRVKGNCLECPFHNWKFRGEDGYCENIPYIIKVIRVINNFLQDLCELFKMYCTWNVKSRYSRLYMSIIIYINSLSIAFQCHTIVILVIDMCKVAASLFANVFVNATMEQMRYESGGREGDVKDGDRNVTENGPDIVYLNELHGPPIFLFGEFSKDERQKGVSTHPIENDNGNHHFTVAQNRDRSREKHKANVHLCHKLMLLERFSIMESDIRAEQIGPGIIELNVNTSFGSLYILLTITLIELLLQRVIYLIFLPPLLAPFANLLFHANVMFERNIRIWNSKRFEQHPILLREDLIIQVYHRWYSQFYSDHSPTYGHEGFTVVAVSPFCNVNCIISVIFV